MILFDTDTLTLFNAGNSKIRSRVEQESDSISITVITRIEVLMGRFDFLLKAEIGEQLMRAHARLFQSDADLARLRIIPIDSSVASIFDRLRGDKKLKRIGRPDLLIACIALSNKALLVTRNLKHFRQISGLRVESWAD